MRVSTLRQQPLPTFQRASVHPLPFFSLSSISYIATVERAAIRNNVALPLTLTNFSTPLHTSKARRDRFTGVFAVVWSRVRN